MKILLILLALFFAGCSGRNSTYLVPSNPKSGMSVVNTQIGVKKVVVPDYLLSDKIMVKEGAKLTSLDANFADSIDSLLTFNAIASLKKTLNDPNVFLYPWDVKKREGVIVRIVIDDYLYYDSFVHLSGSYFIEYPNGSQLASKNFKLSLPAQKNADSIVESLGRVFDKLMSEIAVNIPR